MITALAWTCAGGAGFLALRSLAGAVLDRRPDIDQLVGAALLEVLLLAQLVVGLVAIVRDVHPISTATFVGYLAASVLLLPAGVFWGIADRSRWGNGVLGVAALTVVVVLTRLVQVWG